MPDLTEIRKITNAISNSVPDFIQTQRLGVTDAIANLRALDAGRSLHVLPLFDSIAAAHRAFEEESRVNKTIQDALGVKQWKNLLDPLSLYKTLQTEQWQARFKLPSLADQLPASAIEFALGGLNYRESAIQRITKEFYEATSTQSALQKLIARQEQAENLWRDELIARAQTTIAELSRDPDFVAATSPPAESSSDDVHTLWQQAEKESQSLSEFVEKTLRLAFEKYPKSAFVAVIILEVLLEAIFTAAIERWLAEPSSKSEPAPSVTYNITINNTTINNTTINNTTCNNTAGNLAKKNTSKDVINNAKESFESHTGSSKALSGVRVVVSSFGLDVYSRAKLRTAPIYFLPYSTRVRILKQPSRSWSYVEYYDVSEGGMAYGWVLTRYLHALGS